MLSSGGLRMLAVNRLTYDAGDKPAAGTSWRPSLVAYLLGNGCWCKRCRLLLIDAVIVPTVAWSRNNTATNGSQFPVSSSARSILRRGRFPAPNFFGPASRFLSWE